MNFKLISYIFGLLIALAVNSSAENLYIGDTSAETEKDTLLHGPWASDLIPCFWDDTTAFDGKKSIRVEWDRKMRIMSTDSNDWRDKWLSVAASPDLQMGEHYTFSFYAKASEDNYPISVIISPNCWTFWVEDGRAKENIKLSREWKRYSVTFIPKLKENAYIKGFSAIFDFRNSPVGKVWYDAIQLEKGTTPSPYNNPSPMNVGVSLNSQDWSNIYFQHDPVVAVIRVNMPPCNAELKCKVVDYQGKTVKDFKQAVNGSNEIEMPFDNRLGWFKVTAEISDHGKIISSHSVNYIKVANPVDSVSGIQPFAGLINGYGVDQFNIMKKLGVKRVEFIADWGRRSGYVAGIEIASGKFDWSVMEWQLKRGKEFGMVNKLIANPFHLPDWYFDKEELFQAKKTNSFLVLGRDKHEHWRKFIGEITRRYGDMIDEFELGAEDNGRLGINQYYKALYPQEVKEGVLCGGKPFDDLCAMVKIGADEIRKTHPNMKIGAIRPSLIGSGHTIFIREMLKKMGNSINIFPADFYMQLDFGPLIKDRRRKSDELIGFYNEVKKLEKETGCDLPVYMSEFGWFPDARFSDDLICRREQAETMAKDFIVARVAGYYAFDWYAGFASYGMAAYSSSMQQNMKIQSIAAAYSAAARVVENVTESKWLTPDVVTRIAIMRKHDGKGVAAIWADEGYKFSLAANSGMVMTDLMGNQIQAAEGQFTLSQAPVYIWHKDYKELCEILAKTEIEMTEFCDIKFRMVSENIGRLQFVNLSNTIGIEVNADITVNDKTITKTIDVPKGTENTCDIPLVGKTVKVKAQKSGNKTIMEKNFELDVPTPVAMGAMPATLIAKAVSRGDVLPLDPWVPWTGPDDLSVQITSSWDKDNLYLKTKVRDDLHFNKFNESPYKADSLQIAIDPKNNGAFYVPANGKKLGLDDFEFCLALCDDSKSRSVSSHGKDICQADNYTITRDEKEKTTTYELRLPWKSLGVKPYAGMVFGMSFVVFDDDSNSGQNYYIPIGGGIAGVKNPALYKKLVLK